MLTRRQLIGRMGTAALLAGGNAKLADAAGRPGLEASSATPCGQTRSREFFYRPACAWAGDFIPFCKDGTFHLFYLLDWRDRWEHGEGVSWYQVSTRDFVHFTDHGEMLAHGTEQDQDLYVFTGSVIEAEGRFHIYYTGHNGYLEKQGKPRQAIMHAVSEDLLHWQKIPHDIIYAPEAIYARDDWRDAFVFRNQEAGEYWMLVAARLKTGPSRRRGCTALCTSKDLKKWEVREPFYAPGLYYTHECPDLFRMGDWWYLIFSEFSDRKVTRYRMSRSLKGPWLVPANDTFDGLAYYAAKTAADGNRRFIFGWNPTRDDNNDNRSWQWGGNLVVHEVVQERDGTLSVRMPETVERAFGKQLSCSFKPSLGKCEIAGDSVKLAAPGSFACAVAGSLPKPAKVELSVAFEAGTKGCGIMIGVSDDLEKAYYIRLEPDSNRLVLDSWPRAGGVPFMVGIERPMALKPGGTTELKVIVDASICEIYAGGKIAMSTRMYGRHSSTWGVFAKEGAAQFRNFRVTAL